MTHRSVIASLLLLLLTGVSRPVHGEPPEDWFVMLDSEQDVAKLPANVTARPAGRPDAEPATQFNLPDGRSVLLEVVTPSPRTVRITRLHKGLFGSKQALSADLAQSGSTLRVHFASPDLAVSPPLRRFMRLILVINPDDVLQSDAATCSGELCTFAFRLRGAIPRSVRLEALVVGVPVLDKQGAESSAARLPVNGGAPVARWLAGADTQWDTSGPRAIVRMSIDRAKTDAPAIDSLHPLLRALSLDGGASLKLSFTGAGTGSGSLNAPPGEPGVRLNIEPRLLGQLRLGAGSISASILPSGVEIVPSLDGPPAQTLELVLTGDTCQYTVKQLTVAGAGLEHAAVLFGVRRSPESCPAVQSVASADAAAALDVEQVRSLGRDALQVKFRALPATPGRVTLRFSTAIDGHGGAAETGSMLVTTVPAFAPDEILIPVPMLENASRQAQPADTGRKVVSAPLTPALVEFLRTLPGTWGLLAQKDGDESDTPDAGKAKAANAEPTSSTAASRVPGNIDATDRKTVAIDRTNIIVFSTGPESWDTKWQLWPATRGYRPCDDPPSIAPAVLPAGRVVLCVKPTARTSSLELQIRLRGQPRELAVTEFDLPDLRGMIIDAGRRTVSVPISSEHYRLAIDLSTQMKLKCGDETLGHRADVKAMRMRMLESCHLTLNDIPLDDPARQAELAKLLEPYGKQTLTITIGTRTAKEEATGSAFKEETQTVVFDPETPGKKPPLEALGRMPRVANLGAFDELQIKVAHQKATYVAVDGISNPDSDFTATVRRIPTLAPSGIYARLYLTFPVQLALMRYPSSGSQATRSSEVNEHTERADFGAGVAAVLEWWDFDHNRPLWGGTLSPQLNLGLISTIPYSLTERQLILPGLSLVFGLAVRIPPSTATPIDSALKAVIWYEHAFRIPNSPVDYFDALLVGFGVNFGAAFE